MLSAPIAKLSETISDALDDFQGLLEDAGLLAIGIGVVILTITVAAVAIAIAFTSIFSAGTLTLPAAIVGIAVILTISGALIGVGAATYVGSGDIIDSIEENFRAFAGDDPIMNAEKVGGCVSGIVLRGNPPDIASALADEVHFCLEAGRKSNGLFTVCRDAIVISKPEPGCDTYVAVEWEDGEPWYTQTDECSVTFMLALFYDWKWGGNSNNKCECGGQAWCVEACCADPGSGHVVHDEGGNPVDLRQMGDINAVVWDPTLCGDGKIDADEECMLEMYYYANQVHVRGLD